MGFELRVLGLTGGIGMGKSTAAELLAQRGVAIVDTDVLARRLVEPGQPALLEIREAFGADMITSDGCLRRDQLAGRVFSDHAAREKLENILHPRIRQLWQTELSAWRSAFTNKIPKSSSSRGGVGAGEVARFFCVVIPLLFETHAENEVDITICIACSSQTQHERLRARGWTAEQIENRIGSQLPIVEKMARADYVIWNEGPLEALSPQLIHVLRSGTISSKR